MVENVAPFIVAKLFLEFLIPSEGKRLDFFKFRSRTVLQSHIFSTNMSPLRGWILGIYYIVVKPSQRIVQFFIGPVMYIGNLDRLS